MAMFPEPSLAMAQVTGEGLLTELTIRLSLAPSQGSSGGTHTHTLESPPDTPGRGQEGREAVVAAATATHGFFLHLTGLQDLSFLPC